MPVILPLDCEGTEIQSSSHIRTEVLERFREEQLLYTNLFASPIQATQAHLVSFRARSICHYIRHEMSTHVI